MTSKLPQDVNNKRTLQKRNNYLQRMQRQYQFTYEYANTIAILRKLPCREIPGLYYWWRMGLNLLQLIPSLPSLFATIIRYLLGRDLESYTDYVFYPRSPQPDPDLANNFQDDLNFGLQRVIGVNPAVLRAVSLKQPLPDALSEVEIQKIVNEQVDDIDYATALEQKRLYVLDYAVLDTLKKNPGTIDGGRKQFITTPIIVLIQQSDGMLRPVAIQLHQDPGPHNPIYTKKDNNLWLAAKTFAQIADGNHHILYTHATRIHYVMEAIIMATHRQLYTAHPLHVLLAPHLKYTLNVNYQHTFLRNRKGRPGRFGELFAGDYNATTQCMANAMTSFNFKESAFPKDIANREVDNPNLFYPFRDDGGLLWNSAQNFAEEYIGIFYQSDADIVDDYEVQAWANDISAQDRGRIPGFPTQFKSRQELAETIGHIIFLCTSYHSSIHYHQYRFPGFVPNMPYAAYTPPPHGKDAELDEAGLLNILPAFRAANSQTWTFFLTNFQVNRIGQYKLDNFDTEARDAITRYQIKLKEIDAQIDQRNRDRPVSYDRMNPRNTPNSVSI